MSFVKGLKCRECGTPYPVAPVAICEECFGPLEVDYDYDAIKSVLTRDEIERRPKNLWKFRELMPLDGQLEDYLKFKFERAGKPLADAVEASAIEAIRPIATYFSHA